MPFTNTIKSQTNFNVSELTGYYEYYEGKIGDDSAYLFLQKNLSECNFYTGYMYKKNSIKPIVFTGWEELINQDGLHISYHTYNGKKLYKREQIKTEMIILTNHSHTPEYLGEEFLLEGVRAKDSIEGYAYTFKIPTEKGIGEAFIFKKKQAQTFFDISFYPENTPFYLKRGNKIDTVLSQFGFDSFLPKSEGNIIVKEIESFLMPEWKSILKVPCCRLSRTGSTC